MITGPSRDYYTSCIGSWTTPLRFNLLPTFLGLHMDTTVAVDGDRVAHTTRIRWGPLPLGGSRETFVLDADGRDFTMTGKSGFIRVFGGHGRVDETGAGAVYTFELPWWMLWTKVHQTTVLDRDTLTVHQRWLFLRGTQHLRHST